VPSVKKKHSVPAQYSGVAGFLASFDLTARPTAVHYQECSCDHCVANIARQQQAYLWKQNAGFGSTEPTAAKRIQPEPTQSRPTEVELTQAEPTQTEWTQAEWAQWSQWTQAEWTQAEWPQAEPTQTDPPQAEPIQSEPTQSEPTQAEPIQVEPTLAEPPHAEPTHQTQPTARNKILAAPSHQLFVGRLPKNVEPNKLQSELLQAFGGAKQVDVVVDVRTGKVKGYAFVELESEVVRRKALDDTKGTLSILGQDVVVDVVRGLGQDPNFLPKYLQDFACKLPFEGMYV